MKKLGSDVKYQVLNYNRYIIQISMSFIFKNNMGSYIPYKILDYTTDLVYYH